MPSSDRSSEGSLFYVLPDDVVRVLLAYVSDRPRSSSWQSLLAPRDALALLRAGGPLEQAARDAFSELSMCSAPRSPLALHAPDLDDFNTLAEEIGSNLLKLSVTVSPHSPSRAVSFPTRCNRLRSLRLVDRYGDYDLSGLLKVCRGSLEELDLQGYILTGTHVNAIAENCTGLKALNLQFKMCGEALRHVWIAIGPSLTELAVHGPFLSRCMYPDDTTDPVDEITRYCGKIHTLQLEDFAGEAIRFCQRVSPCLRVLKFLEAGSCPAPNDLYQILDCCPQATVEAFVEKNVVDTLVTLGSKVRVLHLRGVLTEGLEEGGLAVNNVEELNVHAGQGYECDLDQFLAAILSSSKPLLHTVNFPQGVCHWNAIETLAKYVQSLKKFSCTVQKISKDAFQNFAAANPHLQSVSVQCLNSIASSKEMDLEKSGDESAASFVASFATCPALKELVLNDGCLATKSRTIQAACTPLRGRGTDVFVGKFQYFM